MGSDRLSAEESQSSDDTLLRGVADALGRSFDTLSEDPAKALAMPQAGDRIGGRFEVVRWLGRGGFGSVYLARDLELGRDVAIKLMARGHHGSLTDEDRRRFDIEARATARLNHPNVITVHDWGEHQGSPQSWTVMTLG